MFPARNFTHLIGNDMAPGTGKASARHSMHAFLYPLFSHQVAKGLLNSWAGFLVPLEWYHLETQALRYPETVVDYFQCLLNYFPYTP
jgi:hypothetical protein